MLVESPKKKIMVKSRIIIFLSIIVFIGLFIGTALGTRSKMMNTYYSAIDKINEEDYQEAINLLSDLGDYKNSLNQIKLAQTLGRLKKICDDAIEAFNNENYNSAINSFKQIEDFKASEEYITLFSENTELFERINGFEDSKEYIEKANILKEQKDINESLYNDAYKYYESNNYISAIQKFTELNDYNDSKEMLQQCKIELAKLQQATTISAGIRYSTGIVSGGMIKYSGDYPSLEKELSTWKDIISISLKGHLAIGLKKNGTVIVAGTIPEYPDYYIDISTWENIIAVSSGQQYIVGLKSNGTLVAQGHNGDQQLDINGGEWSDIVAISCGWRHTVGLDSNGKIHIAGYQRQSQLDSIDKNKDKWNDIVAISAAGGSKEISGHNAYTAALKQNGKVVTTLPDEIQKKIDKWEDIIAISAGDFYLVGLKSNGDVIIEQVDYFEDLDNSIEEISSWTNIVTISAGRGFTLAVDSNGNVLASGFNKDHQIDIDDWVNITRYEDEWKSIFDEDLRWNGNK